jgi:uncharacterized DUF497 family protein
MELGYDPKKNAWNIRERGLSFDAVAALNWTTAMIRQDKRKDYGEIRYQAFIEGADGKPYVVVFTMRGEVFWIISFRRARDWERKSYAEEA